MHQQPAESQALLPEHVSPLEDVWVAVDLETIGLSADSDEIIEVGAVKFQGHETLDTFHSFVNPFRSLDSFVVRYTGITQEQVDKAPAFSQVAPDLVQFIGRTPVVGHHLSFDLSFLGSKGLRLSNPRCDTWDLSYVLMPETLDYSLARVAASLGIEHPRPHSAIEDAKVTRRLFVKLLETASEVDIYTLAEMERLASRSSWVLAHLLRRLEVHKVASQSRPSPGVSVMGVNIPELKERLKHTRALRPNQAVEKIDPEVVASMLEGGGPLARTMPGFEERPEQIAMARSVAEAIDEGRRLIVEAGTGVGKSLAYLLPAALYALTNNKRVVVSTNTINLQEQLLTKDIPALVAALQAVEYHSVEKLRFAQLKGRANYLCLKRWSLLRSSDSLSEDEARLLSKVLVWLKSTATGDRSEINLGNRKVAAPWERLSAQGALDCIGVNGVCFLRAARDRAAAAHMLIVNHALLMSDLTAGRALIPDYDILIVDEAHHLEEQATKHLGFELGHRGLDDHLSSLTGDRGLLNRAAAAFRGSAAADTRRDTFEEVAARVLALLPSIRDRMASMFSVLGSLTDQVGDGYRPPGDETRITAATRSQPGWSDLEIQWENVDVALSELQKQVTALISSLEGLEEAGLADYEGLVMETANALQRNGEIRQKLREFIPEPSPDGIYWVSRMGNTGDLALHSAPLHIGSELEKRLFSQKEAVILTSATLSTQGTFDHMRERTGFSDAHELLLGSPFDYPKAALLCVPEDMPEPTSWDYQTAAERAITDAAIAAGGRTMALFTSHASLQAAAGAIRGTLQSQGLEVLAQGLDGTPYQIVRSFLENPRSVLLGTASFWEGVDLPGESLQVLLVARLPFSVPTEPVFAARSELYEDSFNEYSVPQAILRVRQGFGRLIRTKTDRGVVVILDRRIVSRKYGKAFLRSLPPVSFKTVPLQGLPDEIRNWLRR